MTNHADRAVELFGTGCACSQAVFGAFAPGYGLDEETAVHIAAGFAAGMKMGETCGAVTGAFMALGLAHAGDACRNVEGRQAVSTAVLAFGDQFKAKHGSLACRTLLGCDISTPEGRQAAQEQNLFRTKCSGFVRDAATIVESLL